jgi:hypothetical protein
VAERAEQIEALVTEAVCPSRGEGIKETSR